MKYILDKILYSSANVKRKWIVAIDREKYIHFFKSALTKFDDHSNIFLMSYN